MITEQGGAGSSTGRYSCCRACAAQASGAAQMVHPVCLSRSLPLMRVSLVAWLTVGPSGRCALLGARPACPDKSRFGVLHLNSIVCHKIGLSEPFSLNKTTSCFASINTFLKAGQLSCLVSLAHTWVADKRWF